MYIHVGDMAMCSLCFHQTFKVMVLVPTCLHLSRFRGGESKKRKVMKHMKFFASCGACKSFSQTCKQKAITETSPLREYGNAEGSKDVGVQ